MNNYFNTINIGIADMVYLDFGILLNQNTTSVAKLVTSLDSIKRVNETLSKIIFDLEAKNAEAVAKKN